MIDSVFLRDTVQMKKPHACGTNEWTVIRTGADIKIKCIKCGRIVMMERQDFLRACRKVLSHSAEENSAASKDSETVV